MKLKKFPFNTIYSMDSDTNSDEQYEIQLVHYTQKYNWDCGLSCIMMILPRKKREFFIKNFKQICEEEGFGRSTWTIDLCYVLKKFSMDFTFCTTYIGVNPKHKSQFFYEKIIHKDKARVEQRFKDAEKNGIDIKKKSLVIDDLIYHIRRNGPVIILTNAGYLSCKRCKRNNLTSKLIHCLPQATNYHGHYIVLCGYNLSNNEIYYRNPAYLSGVCVMEFSTLNKARLCYGTDEDCILIFN